MVEFLLKNPVFVILQGVEEVDYSLYPEKEFQMKWLRKFLTTRNEANGIEKEITKKDLETMYVIVNKFAVVSQTPFFH